MWLNILSHIIISILIIYLLHHLVIYFKETYTTTKTKDVIDIYSKKYQNIIQNIQESNVKDKNELINKIVQQDAESKSNNTKEIPIDTLSQTDLQNMNDEMENFIKETYGSLTIPSL
jgi:hypothetical protein